MKSKSTLDRLELSLIELEYASADFYQHRASVTESDRVSELRALQTKLSEAQQATLAALAALVEQASAPEPENRAA